MKIDSKSFIVLELSKLTGIPTKYETEYFDLEIARKSVGSPSMLKVFDLEGKEHSYMERGQRFDKRGIVAAKFVYANHRRVEDFGLPVNFVKEAKICEGGGWYSKGGIYEVGGFFFEC